jgi:hypothetical protein
MNALKMKFARSFSRMLAIWLVSFPVHSQTTHIQSRYVKETNTTIVTADSLYVINMPGQFMQMQLTGRYPNQGPPATGTGSLSLQFYSYAPTLLYQSDDAHRLAVKADDKVLDFGLLNYSTFAAGANAYLPADALVRTTNRGKNLSGEMMSLQGLPLGSLDELAKARDVVMKIGATVFPLTRTHLSILREFIATSTPVAGPVKTVAPEATINAPIVPAHVPSDANKAPLEQTLKWIKNELSRNSNTKYAAGTPTRIEPADFSGCRIKYRIVPVIESISGTNLKHAIMEYQLNLSELNPESVRASYFKEYSSVFVSTKNNEVKIKVISREDEKGFAGRALDEKVYAMTRINLSNADSAAQMKAALSHAIRLCQSQ